MRAFGSIQAEKRARIIEDNRLCAFCLLHDRAVACRTRENKSEPACCVPKCEGRHATWLHELLKAIYGKKGQVHLLQGETGWRTPEETWMEDEREEEEEVMFVNTVQQEEDDWQEPDDSWRELDGGESEEEAGVYCISACLRKDNPEWEDELEYFHDVAPPPEEKGAAEVRRWSSEPQGSQSGEEDEGENQYLVNLLTGGLKTGRSVSEMTQAQIEAAAAPVARDPRHSKGQKGGREALRKTLTVASHLQRGNPREGRPGKRRCVVSGKDGRLQGEMHG
jgi:hypothetical protein